MSVPASSTSPSTSGVVQFELRDRGALKIPHSFATITTNQQTNKQTNRRIDRWGKMTKGGEGACFAVCTAIMTTIDG